jgi:predicted acetyltransferase
VSITIRPCQDDAEMAALARIVAYSFAESIEDATWEVAFLRQEDTMCAFDGETLATSMGGYPFTVRLNGAPVRMAGITQVGTLPAFRRRGLLRRVMQTALSEYRDRGESYAILLASMAAIYQRFGFGLAANTTMYTFDPRQAALREPVEPTGSIELLERGPAPAILRDVYERWAERRTLCLERTGMVWSARERFLAKGGAYHALYRNPAGEPEGYITYTTKEMEAPEPILGPDQEMQVIDYVAVTIEAWRQLWEYIRKHDLAGHVRMGRLGDDDPAWQLALEPRQLHRKQWDRIWMRVIDVERGLPQRPYEEGGRLAIRIAGDSLCPWNEGTWLLETDGPTTTVKLTDAEPDLTMPPRPLAQLLAGHTNATTLARAGLIEAHDPKALRLADHLFATKYRPHCPDGF